MIGQLSRIPELFLDVGDMTSSGSGSGGSTTSCGELPTRDWETGDVCEAVAATVMGAGRRGGGFGDSNHNNHNHNNHNSPQCAQTKSINSTQNCYMTTSAYAPGYQEHANILPTTDSRLPTIPHEGGAVKRKEKDAQTNQQQHLNSEVSNFLIISLFRTKEASKNNL